MTKWITSGDEVNTQIPEADRSTKVVKTFEAEPQSSSILELNWNVGTDNLIVCRGTEQEVTAKITQRIVLSFVSAVFDPLGIYSPFTIRMRFLLKSIWAALRQAWDKESTEHSKLFTDWCSELREIRTMSINRLYFENGCTNLRLLRLHIFTIETHNVETHLCDREMSCGTHQTYDNGVRLRKQILREYDVRIDKICHWTNSSTVLHWL